MQVHTYVRLVLLHRRWGTQVHLVYRTLGSWTDPACVLHGSFLPAWSSWSVQVLPPHEPSSSLVCSNPGPVPSHLLRQVTRRVFPSAARLRPASPLHLTSGGKWLSYAPLSLLVGQVVGEHTADRLLEGRGEHGSQKGLEDLGGTS